MNLKENVYFIIDFDSTFVSTESLDELANIALIGAPHREEILKKLKRITNLGMEGKISFSQSLRSRLKLFQANTSHIERLIVLLKKHITPSILRNREFFRQYKDRIYILSGGFSDYIIPIFKPFGISNNHILANKFLYDKKGNVIGYDKTSPLSKKGGKILALKSLRLVGRRYVIGDGSTDLEIKKAGLADKFFYFSENVFREKISERADSVLPNFDEFLYKYKLPRALSYPKNRIKVLLLEGIHADAINMFKKDGYVVESFSHALSERELLQKIPEVSILCIRSKVRVTEALIKKATRLLAVGRYGVGVNNIDLPAATKYGVAVFNAPFSNTRSVVELAMGEMIILARNIVPANQNMHKGVWRKSSQNSAELRGKTLGIIGYGNIGSQLSLVAEAFGMNVLYFDLIDKLPLGNAKQCKRMDEILAKSDFVTVHVDKSSGGFLITEKEFKKTKPGVIFLNLSRGFAVDPNALYENLKNGKVKGAAIDVYVKEPYTKEAKFKFILQGFQNVILTPHIAGSTFEAQRNAAHYVTEKLITYINTGASMMSVNFPNVFLPELRRSHRLIHIHKNVPGVLAHLNEVISSFNLNIEGQYLKTNQDIGYVITDVSKSYDKNIIKKLREVPDTIKARVLY